jgi:hypothetical protein
VSLIKQGVIEFTKIKWNQCPIFYGVVGETCPTFYWTAPLACRLKGLILGGKICQKNILGIAD